MAPSPTENASIAPLYNAISDIVMRQVHALSEFELIRILQRPPYSLLSSQALQASLDLFQTHFLVFHCLHRLRIEWQRDGLGWLRIEPLVIQLVPERVGTGCSAPSAYNDSGATRNAGTNSDSDANDGAAEATSDTMGGGSGPENRMVRDRATGALQPPDHLAAYYLDMANLHATGAQDVERLLDSFWRALDTDGASIGAPEFSATDSRVGPDRERQQREALRVLELSVMPDEPAQLKRQFRMLLHRHHPDKGGSNTEFRRLQWAYQVVQTVLP